MTYTTSTMTQQPLIDSAHLLDNEGVECTSWTVPVTDGALKTLIHRRNLTRGEVQPLTICFADSKAYFKVKTRIVSCIHGHLETVNGSPTRPGTLLVLEYRLHPKGSHRFSEIYTSFTFKDMPGTHSSNPRIVSYAPFPRPRRFHPEKQTIERTIGLSGNLGVREGLPVSAEVSSEKSATTTHVQEYFAKGTAGVDPDEATGVENTIWWRLEENRLQKHGVLEVFRVAVLVERDSENDDFLGEFTMDVKGTFTSGGSLGRLSEKVTRFWRHNKLDDPVRFSPSRVRLQGKTDGIDPNALASLVRYTSQGEGVYLPEEYELENLLPAEAFIGQFSS